MINLYERMVVFVINLCSVLFFFFGWLFSIDLRILLIFFRVICIGRGVLYFFCLVLYLYIFYNFVFIVVFMKV